MRINSELDIESFLQLGYFLNYQPTKIVLPNFSRNSGRYEFLKESELVSIGKNKLLEVFSNCFVSNSDNFVPLSGGYDSRAILGGLMEFTECKNITTFTFGIPGSLDFEIGKMLSKKLGIKNVAINLNEVNFSQEMLMNSAKRFDFQTFLFFHPDYEDLELKFGKFNYWSGFLGGEVAGSHYPKWETKNLSDDYIKKMFLKKNRYVNSIDLSSGNGTDISSLISGEPDEVGDLTRYEKLDFLNRQVKYIAPHVMPNGFDIKAPFASLEWVDFMLSIPNNYRENLYLYEKILLKTFPYLFGLPVKNKFGLPINNNNFEFLSRKILFKLKGKLKLGGSSIPLKLRNYYDFGHRIRTDDVFKTLVFENITDLKKRGIVPWVNLDNIISNHINKNKNHADAIQVLSSLEIILKAKDENEI